MRSFLSLLLLFNLVYAGIDNLYQETKEFLSQTINRLDIFLSDSNKTVKQHFNIRSSIDMTTETKQNTTFRFNIKANVELPRTKKRLHLFLQDFKEKLSIDQENGGSVADSIRNDSFLLGFSYQTSKQLSYKIGVRFRKVSPDLFAQVGWEDTFHTKRWWIYYGANARYFLDKKWDNSLFFNYNYKIKHKILFAFENSARYTKEPNDMIQYSNALKIYYSPSKYEIITPHFDIYSTSTRFQTFRLNYYYLGLDYQNRIWRKWIFYQLSPAILYRRENSFDASYRILAKIGITFEEN